MNPADLAVIDRLGLTATTTQVGAKIDRLRHVGVARAHCVFDWDRTLTVPASGDDSDPTVWRVLSDLLPEAAREEYRSLFARFRPAERAGTLSEHQAAHWWRAVLQIIVRSRVSLADAEHVMASTVALRPGTGRLFRHLTDRRVPRVILSAGVSDLIEGMCRRNRLQPSGVIATRLATSDGGTITGWDPGSLVHPLNKPARAAGDLAQIQRARPFTILLGDSPTDSAMVQTDEPYGLRICVGSAPPAKAGEPDEAHQRTLPLFDLTLRGPSLTPVTRLLRYLDLEHQRNPQRTRQEVASPRRPPRTRQP